ncbi:Uu.00g053710.m01.CDS01 [Anthostomella pinea]|uniref:Uu.00g053710.m01.CDS01 n=1 Tax=Anthostomella pinea TaxID=933095 RepID=A0AAI8VQS3_9PEZI|nr:Uu.00g053710.m01.CDS01 [Anthostomella pinea]
MPDIPGLEGLSSQLGKDVPVVRPEMQLWMPCTIFANCIPSRYRWNLSEDGRCPTKGTNVKEGQLEANGALTLVSGFNSGHSWRSFVQETGFGHRKDASLVGSLRIDYLMHDCRATPQERSFFHQTIVRDGEKPRRPVESWLLLGRTWPTGISKLGVLAARWCLLNVGA